VKYTEIKGPKTQHRGRGDEGRVEEQGTRLKQTITGEYIPEKTFAALLVVDLGR